MPQLILHHLELAAAGVKVIVGARNVPAAKEQLKGIPNVTVESLDLSDLTSVEQFSNGIVKSKNQVDMFICNAGIMASNRKPQTNRNQSK